MPQDLMQDQRVFERFKTELPSRIKKENPDEERNVLLKDLSANGANILTTEPLPLLDKISLIFEHPNSIEPLDIKGQVVWRKQDDPHFWKIGIQFDQVDLLQAGRILSTFFNKKL